MPDSLADITARLRAFVAERDWAQFHDPKNLAMAVASEAGELVAEYRWIANDQADVWSADPENKKRVAMEAADVAIAVILLCDRVGIDLPAAITAKIALNAERYPAAQSKGRHSRPS
jgi:NTP pyrophosphatase (non-canonical NTP hydrolase)